VNLPRPIAERVNSGAGTTVLQVAQRETVRVPTEDTKIMEADPQHRDERGLFRLLVVDDHTAYRSAVTEVLSIHEAVGSVEQVDSVRNALVAMNRVEPDLVVMDVHMPEINGIDGAREILRRYPNVRVALCSTSEVHELPELLSIPFESGRVTFMSKGDLETDSLMAWFIESDPPRVEQAETKDT
jgi:CheY-like chemotaxis protein